MLTRERQLKQLLPESIKAQLLAANSQTTKTPICKWFNPTGAQTWILFAAEEYQGEDTILYGCADLGFGVVEYGPMSLEEMLQFRRMGLGIERDINWKADPKKDLAYYLNLDTLAGQ